MIDIVFNTSDISALQESSTLNYISTDNGDGTYTVTLTVSVMDSSYRNRQIMGDNNLTLYYSLAEHVELPVGAVCTFEGETYTLARPQNFKMHHSRYFEYTVTFEGAQAQAKMWKFRNPVDGRLKFSLTAKAVEHLQMFVDNMNRHGEGWAVGTCPDTVEHLVSYDHAYCYDALGQMADEFETEFEIDGKTASLRKVEYNKTAPLSLAYGKGNGFKSGVSRTNTEDIPPVEQLFVQGGDRNIDYSAYGYKTLMLPANGEIGYDGTCFDDEDDYDSTNARQYAVSEDRCSVVRSDKEQTSHAEDSLDCSDCYPSRVGTVTAVECEDEEQCLWNFYDTSIPDTLDYESCLIEGETMTVIFQSGELAGREFDVAYDHDSRKFEIVPAEIDGMTMPGGSFIPAEGDTYAIFNCMLPDPYISDSGSKSGAEWDMFREAVRYMYEHETENFTFSGTLDGIWAKNNWATIGSKIILGGYISFTDERFQTEPVLVRIIAVKDYVNKPNSPEITLSNQSVTASFSSTLKQLESQEVAAEERDASIRQYVKRKYRDATELREMLEDALLDFSEGISPVTVATMQTLIGDESLQYRFIDSVLNGNTVEHEFTYDPDTCIFSTSAGLIQHMTLNITQIGSTRTELYPYWNVSAYESEALTTAKSRYYCYIKAEKTFSSSGTAEFLLSETANAMESVDGYYHFLVGVLGSASSDGTRAWSALYGYTEILPGQINSSNFIINTDTLRIITDGQVAALFSNGRIKAQYVDCQELNAYDKDGNLVASLNKDDDGVLKYYYANGQVMKEEVFLYDDDGDLSGAETRYYDQDGNILWTLNSKGLTVNTITTYWTSRSCKILTGTTQSAVEEELKEFGTSGITLGDYYSIYTCKDSSSEYYQYNGHAYKGSISSALPTSATALTGWIVTSKFAYAKMSTDDDEQKFYRTAYQYSAGVLKTTLEVEM